MDRDNAIVLRSYSSKSSKHPKHLMLITSCNDLHCNHHCVVLESRHLVLLDDRVQPTAEACLDSEDMAACTLLCHGHLHNKAAEDHHDEWVVETGRRGDRRTVEEKTVVLLLLIPCTIFATLL